MPIANYFYLDYLLGSLNVLTPDEESRVGHVDPNDEIGVRSVIVEFIRPEFERLSDDSKTRIKTSLQYFLTTQKAPFLDIIRSQQDSPLDRPDQPILFFKWIWAELFPGESYLVGDLNGWTIDNRPETLQLAFR